MAEAPAWHKGAESRSQNSIQTCIPTIFTAQKETNVTVAHFILYVFYVGQTQVMKEKSETAFIFLVFSLILDGGGWGQPPFSFHGLIL